MIQIFIFSTFHRLEIFVCYRFTVGNVTEQPVVSKMDPFVVCSALKCLTSFNNWEATTVICFGKTKFVLILREKQNKVVGQRNYEHSTNAEEYLALFSMDTVEANLIWLNFVAWGEMSRFEWMNHNGATSFPISLIDKPAWAKIDCAFWWIHIFQAATSRSF